MKLEDLSLADLKALQDYTSPLNYENPYHRAILTELDRRSAELEKGHTEQRGFHFPAWLGTNGWRVEIGTNAKRFTRTGYELDIFFSGTDNEVFSIRHISDSSKFWVTLFGCAKLPNNATEAEIFMSKFNL